MSGIEEFYVHGVTVQTWEGTGAAGDVYSDPVPVAGFLDGETRLVRDAQGQQVVAASSFYCSPAEGALFTPDSMVTVASPGSVTPNGALVPGTALAPSSVAGRVCRVITQSVNDAPGLGLPDHSQIYLK